LANGCTSLTAPVASGFFLCDALGNGRQGITVPPGLGAFTFNVQVVVLDSGAAGGLTVNNGAQPSVL
jgi:hypothetical protein